MLLPSAVSCDSNNGYAAPSQSHRLQAAAHFASPPSSPPPAALGLNNLFATCRSLQALLAAAPAPSNLATPPQIIPHTSSSSSNGQLPSPPLAHAPPPLKLRLRPRKPAQSVDNITNANKNAETPRKRRVAKRAPPPLRGATKRRRSDQEDEISSESEPESHNNDTTPMLTPITATASPHTPKRARIAPAVVPLGLERSDFHDVYEPQQDREGTEVEVEADGQEWSAEDDRILVELILEKLKLTKEEWQDCARSLGRDKASLGRRWKSLMAHGDVGLKSSSRSRRGRIHGTWR